VVSGVSTESRISVAQDVSENVHNSATEMRMCDFIKF